LRFYTRSSNWGSHIVIAGQYVVTNIAISIATKNGIMRFVTEAIEVLPTLQPTNKHVPTGGLINPMHKLASIICRFDYS
jgi:hypothetical protein